MTTFLDLCDPNDEMPLEVERELAPMLLEPLTATEARALRTMPWPNEPTLNDALGLVAVMRANERPATEEERAHMDLWPPAITGLLGGAIALLALRSCLPKKR